ncbi:hypothetical protein [Intrasporangium sp. YIM S08009]|uniref:hypothetical protein n=1 Tax=Intrasporangium zincisolvens TaxID=3080018 RepID=UPI002B061AE5|nr:hypothetical protein [Intrasporangium sp. YIM S08009]
MSDDVVDLLKSVPEPPMTVDPYAAMATVRRNQARRRRIVTAAVAAAIAIAVAVGSAIVAGRDRALPAHPTPTAPTTPIPSTPRSLVARFGIVGNPFTATLDSSAWTVTVQPLGSPAGSGLALSVPDTPGGATCQANPSLYVYVCVVRAPVRAGVLAYGDPTAPDLTVSPPDVRRFSVPDVSVLAAFGPAPDVRSVRGTVYEMDDGTVADSSGGPVSQAHARQVPVTIFLSGPDRARVMGLRPDSIADWSASTTDGTGATHTGMGDLTGDYYAYLLPPGAVSGHVRPPGSATVVAQEVLVLAGQKVLVAQLAGVKHFQGPAVDWVDARGGTHVLAEMSGAAPR